jgi:hypothetical protein
VVYVRYCIYLPQYEICNDKKGYHISLISWNPPLAHPLHFCPVPAVSASAPDSEIGSVTDDQADGDGGGGGGVGYILMKNPSAMVVLLLDRIWFPLALGTGSLAGKCQ